MAQNTHRPGSPAIVEAGLDELRVRLTSYDPELFARIRRVPGAHWDWERKLWRVPATATGREALARALGESVPNGLDMAGISLLRSESAGALLGRFEEEMKLRAYSPRTRTAYLGHIRRFVDQLPEEGDLPTVLRQRLLELEAHRKVSRSYHDQLISALRLFCARVLGEEATDLPLERPRRESRLPDVLSREELSLLFAAVENMKHRLILLLGYSGGLRVSEVVALRPEDVDWHRGMLRIRGGKGRRDRYTLLAQAVAPVFEAYVQMLPQESVWLFPGGRPGAHLNTRTVQKLIRRAAREAGIEKRVTPHVLRHSFATHLLENGTDIRYIQEILGHASIRTTQIYTHVTQRDIARIRSPLDVHARTIEALPVPSPISDCTEVPGASNPIRPTR